VGHEEHCPDINGPGCAEHPVATQWHALKLFFSDIRLNAEYGITDWLSIDLLWSLRIVDIKFELQDLDRRPIAPPYGEEIHHRTETIAGITDPWLSLRANKRLGAWTFGFRAGATLPIGSTVENPFRLGREGMSHQHIQFGTGTVDPFVEVQVSRTVGRFMLTGWTMGKLPLYENGHGYRAGSTLFGGLRATSNLWTERWTFSLGTFVYHEQPERWSGIVETEGNLGRTDLLLESSITWRFAGAWSLFLLGRIPVYSHITGAQLNNTAVIELGITRPFRLVER
jgi:hypothetical protein